MIKKTLITFADNKYENARLLTINNCSNLVDNVINYKPEDIDKNFYKKNIHILSQQRGYGYWLWKPYFILKTLQQINENDILVYCDSGDTFTSNIINIAQKNMNDGIMLIESSYKNYSYTKGDCFYLMECNNEKYWNCNQIYASISFWKKTKKSIDFLNQWISYCTNSQIITDSPNLYKENLNGFIDHRHDQSILTNLAIKNSIYTRKEKSSNPWDVY